MPDGIKKIALIDLSKESISIKKINKDEYDYLPDGYGFSYKFFKNKWIDALKEPKKNNFITIDTGKLTGTGAPGSGTFSITYVNPFTGELISQLHTGALGAQLKYSGIDHLCILGKALRPVYILINNMEINLKRGSNVWDLNTWETTDCIKEQNDNFDLEIITIGNGFADTTINSCLINNYYFEVGKNGLGKVFQDFLLKALAVNSSGKVSIFSPKEFLDLSVDLFQKFAKRNASLYQKSNKVLLGKYFSPWEEYVMVQVPGEKNIHITSLTDDDLKSKNTLSERQVLILKYLCHLNGISFNPTLKVLENCPINNINNLQQIIEEKNFTSITQFLNNCIEDDHAYKNIFKITEEPYKIALENIGLQWEGKLSEEESMEYGVKFLNLALGEKWNSSKLEEMGKEILDLRRELLAKARRK